MSNYCFDTITDNQNMKQWHSQESFAESFSDYEDWILFHIYIFLLAHPENNIEMQRFNSAIFTNVIS